MNDVALTKIKLPEGAFDFAWCLIRTEDDVIFESFIGIGVDLDFDSCSAQAKAFDNSVYAYAADMNEFWDWVRDGGWDFTILDYERKDYETKER